MTAQASAAIRAARHYHQWGAYATRCFAAKHGVHPSLLRLARQLEMLSKGD